jgi:rhamnosyltransferase
MIVGIIVSYHPEIFQLVSNCKEIQNQVDKLILVENGSDKATQAQICKYLEGDNIIILLESINSGLAKAQNIGIRKGMELGGDYFLLLDDDSKLSEGSVEELRNEFEKNPLLGIAACHILHADSNKEQKYWVLSNQIYKRVRFTGSIRKLEKVNTVISSGSLIKREVIEKCGLMQAEFFIDYIDIEYCLRVRANGYTITVLKNAELIHRLGNTKSIQISKWIFHPTNHIPERRYYMIRNRIWTWKLFLFQFPGWFLIDLGNFFADNLRVFLFEKNRMNNFKFFILGLKDGILKNSSKN